MSTVAHQLIGKGDGSGGVEKPHEHEHVFKSLLSVFKLDCSCGYSGFALGDSPDKVECPMEQVHLEGYLNDTGRPVQEAVATAQVNVDEMVNAAVKKATEPLLKQLSDLAAQLSTQTSQNDKKTKTGGKD